MQIKISIALTDLLIKLQNIMIKRFHLRREGVGGEGRLTIRCIREIKIHVYGKRQTSDLSWEFLRIENKQIKTVLNNSYG